MADRSYRNLVSAHYHELEKEEQIALTNLTSSIQQRQHSNRGGTSDNTPKQHLALISAYVKMHHHANEAIEKANEVELLRIPDGAHYRRLMENFECEIDLSNATHLKVLHTVVGTAEASVLRDCLGKEEMQKMDTNEAYKLLENIYGPAAVDAMLLEKVNTLWPTAVARIHAGTKYSIVHSIDPIALGKPYRQILEDMIARESASSSSIPQKKTGPQEGLFGAKRAKIANMSRTVDKTRVGSSSIQRQHKPEHISLADVPTFADMGRTKSR